MEFNDLNSVFLFIFFFFPGFVSIKTWSLFHKGKETTKDALVFDCIFYSIVNFAILCPILIPFLLNGWYEGRAFLTGIIIFIYCLFAPVLWPFLWNLLRKQKFLYRFIQLVYPTAWDYFMHKRKSCFMIIHLKDDSMIGGYYGQNSYSSTYPDEPSVYLEKSFKINSDGTFGEEITDSFGLVIFKEDFKFIEFFYEGEQNEE